MLALLARERRPAYLADSGAFAEADLSRIWENQSFPPEAMAAADGTRLRVIYRGRRGHGPGPDYRDAIIAAPWGLLEGDVELHLRTSDFRRHGHHLDAAYDGVIVHLVLANDEGPATTLPNGRCVPVVALGDWLEARSAQVVDWLSRQAGWQEPCRDSVPRLGGSEVGRTLDRLGDMRFRAATAAFSKKLASDQPDNLSWQSLLEALGYGGHRERFRRLAQALPWPALAAHLGATTASERRSQAMRALIQADAGGPAPVRGSLRPANRFERRLEGAAALAARYRAGLVRPALALVSLDPRDASRQLIRGLTVTHSVGRSRAVEIAANVVLPLLAAVDGGRHALQAEAIYTQLPLPERYGPVRHLHEAVNGVRLGARRQQGMLYLLKQYCTQGGCGRCPLS